MPPRCGLAVVIEHRAIHSRLFHHGERQESGASQSILNDTRTLISRRLFSIQGDKVVEERTMRVTLLCLMDRRVNRMNGGEAWSSRRIDGRQCDSTRLLIVKFGREACANTFKLIFPRLQK